MSVMETVQPQPERDRWGRPMVVPPDGDHAVAYTRCTTYVGCIEDTYNLSKWQMRMVALGLSTRPDLLLSVAAHREDKKTLDRICADAQEAAKAHAGATTGTALHALTERMDRGLEVGVVPDEYLADLVAYAQATQALSAVSIEQFSVNDELRIGGTPDRVVTYNGRRYIADLKTGGITFGYLKIAAQLAVYSRSTPYDVTTNERMEPHGADTERGIVIHLPAGTGTCTLHWIDLQAGWEAVRVARDVRAMRALPYRDLLAEFTDPMPSLSVQEELQAPGLPTAPNMDAQIRLAAQVKACTNDEQVRALWAQHASDWNEDLTELAKAHIAALATK